MHFDELIIRKVFAQGKYWHYDEKTKKGEWRFKTLPFREILLNNLIHHVPIKLFHNITLSTIFKIVECEPELWAIAIGEPIIELLKESKKKPDKPSGLDYLELGYYMEKDIWHPGVLKEKDRKSTEVAMCSYFSGHKRGEGIPYGLSFGGVNNIINVPIQLNHKLEMYTTHYLPKGEYKHEEMTLGDRSFSLFEIIKEIFYELGWYGVPEKRNKTLKHLQEAVKEAKDE